MGLDVCLLPVGWAVGSPAGTAVRGRRRESQSEHHRAVIPLGEEVRRRAARPDSNLDNILRSHTVQQKGGRRCRKNLSHSSPPRTWNKQQNLSKRSQDVHSDYKHRNQHSLKLKKTQHKMAVHWTQCNKAPAYANVFWPESPHRFERLDWKSLFKVFS